MWQFWQSNMEIGWREQEMANHDHCGGNFVDQVPPMCVNKFFCYDFSARVRLTLTKLVHFCIFPFYMITKQTENDWFTFRIDEGCCKLQ